MIFDYRKDLLPPRIDADLCIVGAGPAGITMARTFIGKPINVCLIESGGLDSDHSVQDLCQASSVGPQAFDARSSRLRAFGGGSEVWGGGCIPLDDIDFTARDWVPDSGWPLSYAELQPFYARARALFRIGHDFTAGSFLGEPARKPLGFDAGQLVNRSIALSPVQFGTHYVEELRRAANIQVLLYANLIALDGCQNGVSVRQGRIGSLCGRRGVVRARQYVLACGAIENARLLLLSDSVDPHGMGNRHDVVGRYFMDHPAGHIGQLHTDKTDALIRAYERSPQRAHAPLFPELCVSEQMQRSLRLLNARTRPVAVSGDVPEGLRAVRRLRSAIRRPTRIESMASVLTPSSVGHAESSGRTAPARSIQVAGRPTADLAKDVIAIGKGVGDVARATARKLARRPAVPSLGVDVDGYFEQAPNPDSRITLGSETDALGQRKAQIDWRLTPLDWHTYRTAARIFGDELARVAHGRFVPAAWLSDQSNAIAGLSGTAHHMGTTRMSADPRKGVVDLDSRVHGMDNLYVAGSSVFPTGGWAFPTYTIVAMSLRLADCLHCLF